MKSPAQIAILMATYNGATYLSEQIDSILHQSFTDWHLFIHDDGSSDGTKAILTRYVHEYPKAITLLDYSPQHGACSNFLSMVERIDAPYYMFCDQDDIWLPDKIAKTHKKMIDVETSAKNVPVIIHTDLAIVDKSLNTIADSFIKDQRIKLASIQAFEDYASTNTVTGCTMLFNSMAKQCMKRPYDKAILHDAWLCLSVSADQGIIAFIDEPLIKYRQHGHNTLGAKASNSRKILYKIRNIRQIAHDNIRHYQEMNAVKPISVWTFMLAKLRYKMR